MSFLDKEDTPLTWDRDLSVTGAADEIYTRRSSSRQFSLLSTQCCGLLFFLLSILLAAWTTVLSLEVNRLREQNRRLTTSNYTELDQTYNTPHTNYLPSPYTSSNTTEADLAWEAIRGGHGIVTVDAAWAQAQNLPESHPDGNNPYKRVYALEAYHVLHCLKTIRREYRLLQSATKPHSKVKPEHLTHCFDAIRQSIVCHADDTLLYGWGNNKVGVGQQRMCRNWISLRDWATEHSACYDVNVKEGEEHFGRCDGGVDGVVV